mmetsp:Transcript_29164/g.63379  ORF Transcript_29164/g.63379 Transcript_29164/m.63379 type:complete len:176 (-) Transcript_29164:190-717(-)
MGQCGCCAPSVITEDITHATEPPYLASQADALASSVTLAPAGMDSDGTQGLAIPARDSFATMVPDRASFRTLVPDRGSFSTLLPDRKSFDTLQPSRLSFGTLVPDRLSFQAPVPEEDDSAGSGSEGKPVLYADSLEVQATASAMRAPETVGMAPHRGFLGRFASIRRSSAPYRGH